METPFSPLQVSVGIFRRAWADNPVAGGPIWPKFELIQIIIHVLINCKFEKKNGSIHVATDKK